MRMLIAAFHQLHQLRYAHNAPEDPVEIVTLRAVATGLLDQPKAQPDDGAPAAAAKRTRRVYLEQEQREVPVFRRDAIGTDAISGPLLVEEDYTVLLIAPDWSIHSIGHGDLIAVRDREGQS